MDNHVININFANPQQREFYFATRRNQCFSGGFNNGKSYAGCLKAITLLTTFANSRGVIARQKFSDLKATTMQTFFKICPPSLIASSNIQDGVTILKNKSQIKWMHLDGVEESTLRGLETNWILVDQAEEIAEETYDVLDARVGRWDEAIIPPNLKEIFERQYGEWPKSDRGKDIAPSYMLLLCNPDTQFHFIYRKYHPDSLEREPDHFFIEGQWDPSLGSKETYHKALRKGEEYVAKFVRGEWGRSNAQIHRLDSLSLLDYSPELLEQILKKARLFRVLDHGDSSPTSCLWAAAYNGVYIFYREYYVPNKTISYHRQAISDLSKDETYGANWADPQIFKKTGQNQGGFWTVALEYLSSDIPGPKLAWVPADNNEFATRNRLNELLAPTEGIRHPVSDINPAPRIYFIKKSSDYPNGCFHAINELQSQRRKLIGYIDGKSYYSDDREESVTDHAYDCIRYFVAMHGSPLKKEKPPVKPMTMAWFKMMKTRRENLIVPQSYAN